MNKIINWLLSVEERAAIFYADAAVAFSDDKKFFSFLSHLAEEEQEHLELLKNAINLMSQMTIPETCIYFDEDHQRTIEAPFLRGQHLLKDGTLTKTELIDIIAEAEFSEWNEIFVYTIDALKLLDRNFQKTVAEIDLHRMHIQNYISSLAEGESFLQKIRRLHPVGNRRILIVEENLSTAHLFKALMMTKAEIVLAHDGEEGLACLQKDRFDLVITDVEIPKINGIEMYKQAVELDPRLEYRFVFFTSTEDPEYKRFFKSSKVLTLPKPSPVNLLYKVINEIDGFAPRRLKSSLH